MQFLSAQLEEIKNNFSNKIEQVITLTLLDDLEEIIEINSYPIELDEEIIFTSNDESFIEITELKKFKIQKKDDDYIIENNELEYKVIKIKIINLGNKIEIDSSKKDNMIEVTIDEKTINSLNKIINKTIKYKEEYLSYNDKFHILFQSLANYKTNLNNNQLEKQAEFILDTLELTKLNILSSPTISDRINNGFFKNGNLYPLINDSKNYNIIPQTETIIDDKITSNYNFFNLGLEPDDDNKKSLGSCDLLNLLDCYSSNYNYRNRNKPGCFLKNCPSNDEKGDYYYSSTKKDWETLIEKDNYNFSKEYLKKYSAKSPGLQLSFKEYNLLSKRGGKFKYTATDSIIIKYGLTSNFNNNKDKIIPDSQYIIGNKPIALYLNQNILQNLQDLEEIEHPVQSLSEDEKVEDKQFLTYKINDGVNNECYAYRYSNIGRILNIKNYTTIEKTISLNDDYAIPINEKYYPEKRYIEGPQFMIIDIVSKDDIKGKVCDGTSNKMEVILRDKIGSNIKKKTQKSGEEETEEKEEKWIPIDKDYNKKVDYRTESIKYINGEEILLSGFVWEKLDTDYFLNDLHQNDKINIQSEYFRHNNVSYNNDYPIDTKDLININYTHKKITDFKSNKYDIKLKLGYNQVYLFSDYFNKEKKNIEKNDINYIIRSISPQLNDIIYSRYFNDKQNTIFNLQDLEKLIIYYNLNLFNIPLSQINNNIYPIINDNLENIRIKEENIKYENNDYSKKKNTFIELLQEIIKQKTLQKPDNFKKDLFTKLKKISYAKWNDFLIFINLKDNKGNINPILYKLDKKNKTKLKKKIDNSINNREIILNLINKLLDLSFSNNSLNTTWSKLFLNPKNKKLKKISLEFYEYNLKFTSYINVINTNHRMSAYDKINFKFLDKLDSSQDKGDLFLTSLEKKIYENILEETKIELLNNNLQELKQSLKIIEERKSSDKTCDSTKYRIRKEYTSLTSLKKDNGKSEVKSNNSTLSTSYGIFADILEDYLKTGPVNYFDKNSIISDYEIINNKLIENLKNQFPQFNDTDITNEIKYIQKVIEEKGILNSKQISKLSNFITEGDYCRLFKKGIYYIYKRDKENQWILVDNQESNLKIIENNDICEMETEEKCIYYNNECQSLDLYNINLEKNRLKSLINKNNILLNLKNTNFNEIIANKKKIINKYKFLEEYKKNESLRIKLISHLEKKSKTSNNVLKLSYILYLKSKNIDLTNFKLEKTNDKFYTDNPAIIKFQDWCSLNDDNNDFKQFNDISVKEENLLNNYKNLLKNKLLESDPDKRNSNLYGIIQKYGYVSGEHDERFIYWDISKYLDKNTYFFYRMCCIHNYISCRLSYINNKKRDEITKNLINNYGQPIEGTTKNCCKYCGEILNNENITSQLEFDEESRLVTNIESSKSIEEQLQEINFDKKYSKNIRDYYQNFILRYINNYWLLQPQLENKDISFILDYYTTIQNNYLRRFIDINSYFNYICYQWDKETKTIITPKKDYLNLEKEDFLSFIKDNYPKNLYYDYTKTDNLENKIKIYVSELKNKVKKETIKEILNEIRARAKDNKDFEKNLDKQLNNISKKHKKTLLFCNKLSQNIFTLKKKENIITKIEKLLRFIEANGIDLENFDKNEFFKKKKNITITNDILENVFNIILIQKSYKYYQEYNLKIGLLSRLIFIIFVSTYPNYNLESRGAEKTGRFILPGNISFNKNHPNLKDICDNKSIQYLFSNEQEIMINGFVHILKPELETNWNLPIFQDENYIEEGNQIISRINHYLLEFFCDNKNNDIILQRFEYEKNKSLIVKENNEWSNFRPPFYEIIKSTSTGFEIIKILGNYVKNKPFYKNNIKINKIFCSSLYLLRDNYYNSLGNNELNKLILASHAINVSDSNINSYGSFSDLVKKDDFTDPLETEFFNFSDKSIDFLKEIISQFYKLFSFSQSTKGKRRIYQDFKLGDEQLDELINNRSSDDLGFEITKIDDDKLKQLVTNHFLENESISIDLISNQSKVEIDYNLSKLLEDKDQDKLIETIKEMKNFMSSKNKILLNDKLVISQETYLNLSNKEIYYNILNKYSLNFTNIKISLSGFNDDIFKNLINYFNKVIDRIGIITKKEDSRELTNNNIDLTNINDTLMKNTNKYIWNKHPDHEGTVEFDKILSVNTDEIQNAYIEDKYKIILEEYEYNLDDKTKNEINDITTHLIVNQLYPEQEINKVKTYILENFVIDDLEPLELENIDDDLNPLIVKEYSFHLFNNYFYHKILFIKNNLVNLISTNNISKNVSNLLIENIEILVNLVNNTKNVYSPIFITDISKIFYSLFITLLLYIGNTIETIENKKLEMNNLFNNFIDNYHINHTTQTEIKDLLDQNIVKKNKENIKKFKEAGDNIRDAHAVSREFGLGNYSQLNITEFDQEKIYLNGDNQDRQLNSLNEGIDDGSIDPNRSQDGIIDQEDAEEIIDYNPTEGDEY